MNTLAMWLLLFGTTAVVAALPMLPAFLEWRRPRDAAPLHIDSEDALDPALLASRFASRLAQALKTDDGTIGRHPLVRLGLGEPWPLTARERMAGQSRRAWFAAGDAVLPEGTAFHAEVAAQGDLRSAPGGTYRALLAHRRLLLAAGTHVLRWAHGREVAVEAGSLLTGRVTADHLLELHGEVRFTLLHAPVLRFGQAIEPAPHPPALPALPAGLPVEWDPRTGRGTARDELYLPERHGWSGDLVCFGRLEIGPGSHARGCVKARRSLSVGAGTCIEGSLVAHGSIELGDGCAVHGVIASETAVVLGRGCVVGMPGRPSTVTAPRIEVQPGTVVHGTVWAGEQGLALDLVGADS